VLVVQNELKWGPLRPTPDTFDFTRPDWLVGFAQEHDLAFRGHCLVWHHSNPRWLADALKTGKPEQILEQHIAAVAGRYRGRMHSWDVVNEAISIKDGRPDGLRQSVWLDALGPHYIERAFRLAAEADPGALLVYNDFDFEYADGPSTQKRQAILKLLERLKAKGAPVHALGIQAHIEAERAIDPKVLTSLIETVAGLGLRVFITELDVDDHRLERSVTLRDAHVAELYKLYLDTVLAHPATAFVTTWGLSDKYTWYDEPETRYHRFTPRPLPLNARMKRKRAWAAAAEAFDRAPERAPLANRQGTLAPVFQGSGSSSSAT
jgi:endo-1,4-beta-xylanase